MKIEAASYGWILAVTGLQTAFYPPPFTNCWYFLVAKHRSQYDDAHFLTRLIHSDSWRWWTGGASSFQIVSFFVKHKHVFFFFVVKLKHVFFSHSLVTMIWPDTCEGQMWKWQFIIGTFQHLFHHNLLSSNHFCFCWKMYDFSSLLESPFFNLL